MIIKCPTCGKIILWDGNIYRPFCSERCKVSDLASWADEKFVISEDIGTELDIDDLSERLN